MHSRLFLKHFERSLAVTEVRHYVKPEKISLKAILEAEFKLENYVATFEHFEDSKILERFKMIAQQFPVV